MENLHFSDVLLNAFVRKGWHYSALLLMISTILKVFSKDGEGTTESAGDRVR